MYSPYSRTSCPLSPSDLEGDFLERLYSRLDYNFSDSEGDNFKRNLTRELRDDFMIGEDDDDEESRSISTTR